MTTRPRSPGWVLSVVAAAIIVLLATLALTARPTPPPTIAEFAPQAVDQIAESPQDQLSGAAPEGQGQVARPAGEAATSSPPPVIVPRVRRCVGDPPRQIEDPQSPPCVPYFNGDNGGATYKGVTRDEIRIASPLSNNGLAKTFGGHRYYEAMAAFFNKRFEFYGRRIKIIPLRQSDTAGATNARAAATEADEEVHAFASTTSFGDNVNYPYEVARRKMLMVSYANQGSVEAALARNRPYMWNYTMSFDRVLANLGEWACQRLGSTAAVHAGDPQLQSQPRRYGIVWTTSNDTLNEFTPKALEDGLRGCGQPAVATVRLNGNATDESDVQNAVLQMKRGGVTSVFCLCIHVHFGRLLRGAQAQAYLPEWLIALNYDIGSNAFVHTLAAGDGQRAQLAHTFGLMFSPKELLPADTAAIRAAREVDPDLRPDQSGASLYLASAVYQSMLALASGLQMAGPILTPASFEAGLHDARFPNPAHPAMAGTVGFLDRDYSMTNDGAEIWWSNTAPSPGPGDGAGAFCYVGGGTRHVRGQWPDGGDEFFNGNCDSGVTPVN